MNKPLTLLLTLVALSGSADPTPDTIKPAPVADRVGFPQGYAQRFEVLRVVNKPKDHKIVTVYGNQLASSVTNQSQLPYPYGSVIVMETAKILEDAEGKPILDGHGAVQKAEVSGLHVMRRELGFGTAYQENRAGEWEYVEYKPDGTYITPPVKSGSCAECHVKAGASRDFVYKGHFDQDTKR